MSESIFRLYDFSGGLNVKASNAALADNETPYCKNCLFDAGAIVKRKGYTRYNATSLGTTPIRGVYPFYKSNLTRQIMIAHGGNLYAGDKAGNVGTAIKTELVDIDVNFTTLIDKCIITNGTDSVLQWDGTTLTTLTNAKKGKYIVNYFERVFVANVGPNQQSFVWWSNTGDPATWGLNNFLAIATDDGDVITGLAVLQIGLVVFKNRSTFIIYGDSFEGPGALTVRRVFPKGCIAPKSIAHVGNGVIWLADDGVYSYDGATLNHLSAKVDPILEKANRKDKAVGGIYKHFYWLAYTSSTGTENDSVLVLDLETGAWTQFTNMSISCMAVLNGRIDNGEFITGSEKEGLLYWQDTGSSDDGTVIPMEWHSKYFNMGGPEWDKIFRKLAVDVLTTGAMISVDYDIDNAKASGMFSVESGSGLGLWGDGGLWGTGVWNAPVVKPFSMSLPMNALGKNMKLVVRNSDDKPDVKVSGLIVKWMPKRIAI